MHRRCFLAVVAVVGAGLVAPTVLAQSERVYRIAVLNEGRNVELRAEMMRGLTQRGYVEGRNLILEMRSSQGDPKALRAAAEELARMKVDVVIAASTRPAVVMREVSKTIPILVSSADPVGAGLVASLARPGGNVTGVLIPLAELASKRLQMLKEMLPGLARVTVLWNPTVLTTDQQLAAVQAAARPLGVAIDPIEIRNAADLDRALAAMAKARPQALITIQDSFLLNASERLGPFTLEHRIPMSSPYRRAVDAGGLFSYGSTAEMHRVLLLAQMDKIFKGAKPGDLPVELPEQFELVINAKTAQLLGIDVPRGLLLRATEVIR